MSILLAPPLGPNPDLHSNSGAIKHHFSTFIHIALPPTRSAAGCSYSITNQITWPDGMRATAASNRTKTGGS